MKHFIKLQIASSLLFILIVTMITFISCSNTDTDATDTVTTQEVDNYAMIATGQTILYNSDGDVVSNLSNGDACYGQDANYLKGKTMAYNDNGNSTVTDLKTGLMWQQAPSSSGYTWQQAVDYCNNLELGGYSDWRIPSCKELYSIFYK